MEQIQLESLPTSKEEGEKLMEIEKWSPLRQFQHFALLYIKYIEIIRIMEESYDQLLQPQKRALIKKMLESTIIRLLEVKETLLVLNPRKTSIYINLDDLLMDLKLDPDSLEIPIPRYFAEENRDYLEKRAQLVNKLFISNFNSDQP